MQAVRQESLGVWSEMILPLDSQLAPRITFEALQAIEADEVWMADEAYRCSQDPWYWAVNYIYTIRKDEFTSGAKPEVLRFPPKEHLRYMMHKCFVEPMLVVDKSRQMTLSWLVAAYELHIAQFGSYEEIIFQTKKEVDVDALISRVEFMVKGQRFWLRPEIKRSHCLIKFPGTNCTIRGLPGGSGAGDQIRSANPSRYWLDEGGFVDEFEDCRTAALACCQDIKIISTANAGEFESFVHDKIEEVT